MSHSVPILVVIPCLNEAAHLALLVEGLMKSNPPQNWKFAIVDGGSHDGTVAIALALSEQFDQCVYLHNPRRIQSVAVNLAVDQVYPDARYLIRIDAHADYPPDYCQVLLDEAIRMNADAVVVPMETRGKTSFQKAVAAAQNSKLGNGGSSHRIMRTEGEWVSHGHHALIRVGAFRDIQGYDETFSHNEDAELDARLIQSKYKIWLTRKTSMIYYPRSSPLPLFRQYVGYGYGRASTIFKHREFPKIRQLLPAAVAPLILLAIPTPWTDGFSLPLVLWLSICLGYGLILTVQRRDMSIIMSGPAAAIMHFGWSIGFWKKIVSVASTHHG